MMEIKITAGYILDLIFGDPAGFPHPVILMGKLIHFLEGHLRKIRDERFAGVLLLVLVALPAYYATYLLASLSPIIEVFIIYTVFAAKSLGEEAMKIYRHLERNDFPGARRQVGYLVSRDTGSLDEEGVIRAAVETVSENTVDGIISPMFYLFIGGAPLAMAFKAVSTLDSMVGYKNERYLNFGWASARTDDVMNFLPARIAAFIMIPAASLVMGLDTRNLLKTVKRDRHNHASPNSGHPEAAFAGALQCRLGGPASYFGTVTHKPYIGDPVRELGKETVRGAVRLMYGASAVSLITGVILSIGAGRVAGL